MAFGIIGQLIDSSRKTRSNKLRNEVLHESRWIKASDFLGDWQCEYRNNDRPGCYAIFIFREDQKYPDCSNYIMSYGGQSTTVFDRVHNHLTGKGNGDVYADYRNGKQIFIQFFPCELAELNDTEREVIASLDPRRRYNKNIGGATIRSDCGEPVKVNVPIRRAELQTNSAMSVTILCDGRQISKLANGKSTSFVTTKGTHTFTFKILGLSPVNVDLLVQDGWGILVEASLFTVHSRSVPISQLSPKKIKEEVR